MRPILLVVLAIAAVLCGAPSPASATDTGALGRPTAVSAGDAASTPLGFGFEPLEIAIGIGGIAALAFFAGFLVLHVRRRRVGAKSSVSPDEAPPGPTAAEEQVTAALHRRTLRRARVRLKEDPIIASMRVGSGARAEPGVSRAQRSARRSPPT